MSWITTPRQVLDPDTAAYITAVEAIDGQALETNVRLAINTFVVGCKADGIWNAIKASCILAGARTLAGALVPLVGDVPTKFGTEGGWNYNRETGLAGNGTNNYLNANINSNTLGQNNIHLSCFLTSTGRTDVDRAHISTGYAGYPDSDLSDVFALVDNRLIIRNRNANGDTQNFFPAPAGSTINFIGSSRDQYASWSYRKLSTTGYVTNFPAVASYTPLSSPVFIFARPASPAFYHSSARISFYSIGESLDLALLDARVATLMSDLAAAIP